MNPPGGADVRGPTCFQVEPFQVQVSLRTVSSAYDWPPTSNTAPISGSHAAAAPIRPDGDIAGWACVHRFFAHSQVSPRLLKSTT